MSKMSTIKHGNAINLISRLFQPKLAKNVDTRAVKSKSYKLMIENGILQSSSPGIFHLLPLGVRSLEKLVFLVDKHMYKIGAQKIDMPCLHRASSWKISDRWKTMHKILYKLEDSEGREFCLGPTHEEAVSVLLSQTEHLSPKQIPLMVYQIGKKYRDEQRTQSGLLRAREFLMKDMYTFDEDLDGAERTYQLTLDAYRDLFDELEVDYHIVEASSGDMGGIKSHEIHYVSEVGEDHIRVCKSCKFGASIEFLPDVSKCPKCDSELETHKSIEVGHAFLLGKHYTEIFDVKGIDRTDKPVVLEMGCYGLGISRIMAASTEVLSSDKRLVWPSAIAPFTVCIIPTKGGAVKDKATELLNQLYSELSHHPVCLGDVIIDDRMGHNLGYRYHDAVATGYPVVIVLGKQALSDEAKIEINFSRTGERTMVHRNEVSQFLAEKLTKRTL